MKYFEKRDNKIVSSECLPQFDQSYDVVVVGLGTTGAISLIVAAEKGLSVLGIEHINGMGGIGTIGGIQKYYFGSKGGRFEKTDEKLVAFQEKHFMPSRYKYGCAKAYLLEKEALKAGAKMLYETIPVGVYMENKRLCGIRIFSDGQFIDVASKYIIDATADAEVCKLADCAINFGREFDKQAQPYTNTNLIIKQDGALYGLNKDSGNVNQSDTLDYTKAILSSNTLPSSLKDSYDDTAKYVTISPILGVREGSLIVGEETVTFEDFMLHNKTYKNTIFYTYTNLDIHAKDIVFEDSLINDWYVACSLWGLIFSIPIPFETLIPKGYDGLLVAGRSLSVDHNISSCVRMQRDMQKCGEAAATLAYLAIRSDQKAKNVEYKLLADILRQSGCLDENNNVGLQLRLNDKELENCNFPTNNEDIIAQLSSNKPGLALWTVRRMGSKVGDLLLPYLETKDANLRRNIAIALGIIGNKKALPELIKMAAEPDNTLPATSDKFAFTRATTAIYLLGKLGSKAACPVLFEIISNQDKYQGEPYEYGELYAFAEEVATQHLLYSVRALLDIAQKNKDEREEIYSRLHQLIFDSSPDLTITYKVNPDNKINLLQKLRQYILYRQKSST